MSPLQTTILVVLIAIAAIAAASAVRIVEQYERGVVFRLGRVRTRLYRHGTCL